MKKFNEFSISAFVATVPEVKEFEKSSVARFCLSVSHTENKGDEKSTKTVGCHGFFRPDTWEEDGKKRSKIIFAVTKLEILTMKDNEDGKE